jgi:hypothetical protein
MRTTRTSLFLALSTIASLGLRVDAAHADGVSPARPDQVQPPSDNAKHEIDRTSLYGDDARIAAPMTVIATTSVSYTNIGSDPTQVSSPYPNVGPGCYTSEGVAHPCYSTFSNNTAQPGGQLVVGE